MQRFSQPRYSPTSPRQFSTFRSTTSGNPERSPPALYVMPLWAASSGVAVGMHLIATIDTWWSGPAVRALGPGRQIYIGENYQLLLILNHLCLISTEVSRARSRNISPTFPKPLKQGSSKVNQHSDPMPESAAASHMLARSYRTYRAVFELTRSVSSRNIGSGQGPDLFVNSADRTPLD